MVLHPVEATEVLYSLARGTPESLGYLADLAKDALSKPTASPQPTEKGWPVICGSTVVGTCGAPVVEEQGSESPPQAETLQKKRRPSPKQLPIEIMATLRAFKEAGTLTRGSRGELVKLLMTPPGSLYNALKQLRADGRVFAAGQKGGMRYALTERDAEIAAAAVTGAEHFRRTDRMGLR